MSTTPTSRSASISTQDYTTLINLQLKWSARSMPPMAMTVSSRSSRISTIPSLLISSVLVLTAVSTLTNKVTVELLGTDSYVTEAMAAGGDFAISGTSPDFTKEEFLAHSQIRINETLNQYSRTYMDDPLGTNGLQFTKSTGEKITTVYKYTQVVELQRVDDPEEKNYLVHSYLWWSRPSLSVHTDMADGCRVMVHNFIEYNSTEDRLRIFLGQVL